MASGLEALSIILGGLGGGIGAAGNVVAKGREEAIEREKLAAAERQRAETLALQRETLGQRRHEFEEGRFTPVPFTALPTKMRQGMTPDASGMVRYPLGALPWLQKIVDAEERATAGREAGGILREAGAAETEAGTPRFRSEEEGSGMTPGPPVNRMDYLARILGTPGLSKEQVTLAQDYFKPQQPVFAPEHSPGYWQGGAFTPTPQREASAVPPPVEGTQRVTKYDARGRPSYEDRPIEARDDFDRAAFTITNGRVRRYEDLTPAERETANAWVAKQPWRNPVAREDERRNLPLTPKQAENFIHPQTLAGPPAGLTMAQAIQQGYVETDSKDRQALVDIAGTKTLAGTLLGITDKLITAKTPAEAAVQYATLTAGAVSGANASARTYQETKEAFLGTLSRTLAGERGVLTNQDIARVARAFPGFFDTVSVKDTKKRLVNALIDVASGATVSKMTKQPINDAAVRAQADKILSQMESAAPAPGGAKRQAIAPDGSRGLTAGPLPPGYRWAE